MKTNQNQQGMAVRSNVKAGSLVSNHNQQCMAVHSKLQAGLLPAV